ncbi:MAG: hypothetical protein SangKO_086780 [Sandaracinaceae bacterium]
MDDLEAAYTRLVNLREKMREKEFPQGQMSMNTEEALNYAMRLIDMAHQRADATEALVIEIAHELRGRK